MVPPPEAPRAGYALEYLADPGCPDEANFSRLVDAQLRQFEGAPTDLAGLSARVTMRVESGGAWARFELKRPDGASQERELRERSCDELAPALAFVLAYALGGAESAARDNGVVTAASRKGDPAPPTAPSAPAAVPAVTSAAESDSEAFGPRDSAVWRGGVGVEFGARSGLAPSWVPLGGVAVELLRGKPAWPQLHVRASFLLARSVTYVDAVGETEFSWWAGRVDVCPLGVPLTRTLSLLPCLGGHVGRIEAAGQPDGMSVVSGATVKKPWFDALLSLRGELVLWNVLVLQARGELVWQLTPYHFAFDNPDTSVYDAPRFASAGFLGLGARFP